MNWCVLLTGLAAVVSVGRVNATLAAGSTPIDVPLCLAAGPIRADGGPVDLVVGYESGRLVCYRVSHRNMKQAWSADAGASILAVLPLTTSAGKGPMTVFVATDMGQVMRFAAAGPSADRPLWTFQASCNISTLAPFDDLDADGVPEIAAGGADHQVHLLRSGDGQPLWHRRLESRYDGAYVTRIINGGDLNRDGKADTAVWTWSGDLHALNGRDGSDLWSARTGQDFLEAVTRLPDLDGDGLSEFAVGGNGRQLRCCGGQDGSIRWSVMLDRPIRDVIAPGDVTGDAITDCFVVTSGGTVACIASDGAERPRWTAALGEVGRGIVSPGDVDGDGAADLVACAENGVTAAFSGRDGRHIWRWQGPDVARTLCVIGDTDGDRLPDVAVAHLDGTLTVLSGRQGGAGLAPVATGGATASASNSLNAAARPAASKHPVGNGADVVPILLYHDILPEAIYRYSTSVTAFRDQMDALVTGGYECVSLDEIADWIEGKAGLPERPICITFDGPYDGHYTHAFDILEQRGLFVVSYITTDWIGTANHADWHHLRKMDAAGVMDVQNHSLNHPSLSTVAREEVVAQLVGANEAIARHLNGKVSRHHAYPNGAYSPEVRRIARELGFRTVTAVRSEHSTRDSDLFALPRYTVINTTTLDEFKRWIRWQPRDMPTKP